MRSSLSIVFGYVFCFVGAIGESVEGFIGIISGVLWWSIEGSGLLEGLLEGLFQNSLGFIGVISGVR